MLSPQTAPGLAALPGIAHGFFTRRGGVSQGIYSSLNCGAGSKDDPKAVQENRQRVRTYLGAQSIMTAYQVHSKLAVIARTPWKEGDRPKADAIVTGTRGIALGVLAADCAPVLFADPHAAVVAAAHAGWRGALGGILESTITAMANLGAKTDRICAAVGPCIGTSAYEVGADFRETFINQDSCSECFFSVPAPGSRPHFDLRGYVVDRLRRTGAAVQETAMTCTFTADQDLFSYRRSQLRKEPDYGRQISAIVLT